MTVLTPRPESGKGRALRLLVLEEDHTVRAQIHQALANGGYEVVLANNGAKALEVLQSEDSPTLAIFDWTNYRSDIGQEIRRLKHRRYLYVIVLLGWKQRHRREEAMQAGADDCLYRSTDLEQLHWHVQLGAQVILERALRESEERFRIAFEQAAIGMAMVDLSDGRFLHVNQALCDFLGYSREELLAKEIMSVSHPDNVPSSLLLTAQMASGGFNGESVERRYIHKNGAVVSALVSLSLVRDEEGRCIYVSAQFKDITKRKAAEEAQQRAEVFAHAIMDNIDDLVMVIDTQARWYYASPSHLDGVGYAPSELIGKDAFCTLHPDDRPLVLSAMQQVFRTGRAPIISVRRLHKDGTVRHFESRGTLVRGLCGTGDGIVVVSRTIDDRLLAEKKVQEASAETELFLQSIPSILIGLDAEGRITRWNRSAAEGFHLSSEEVLGRPIDNCGIKWLHPEMGLEVSRWLQTETAYRCEDLAYELDKSRHYVGFNVRRIECDVNQHSRFLITGADVTERKTLEVHLRQAQKLEAIGQLAAGIAHEINTPTQYVGDNTTFLRDSWKGIANLLQLGKTIRQQAETGAVAKELLEKFDSAAAESDLQYLLQEVPRAIEQSLDGVQRVAKIVKAMKDFSHPGSEEKRAIDINKAIESTVAVARHEWKYVATVVTEFQKDLPLVPCLIGEFNQVILNLIINAAHAIATAGGEGQGEKGTITIRTHRRDEWAEIAVADTGTGIPDHLRSRIFEPFFTTKPVGQGTGQGLALAHSVIVKRHQGQIWFETETGRGTTFFLRLPLQTPEKVS
jgi:PAS domain S-box-containing protein